MVEFQTASHTNRFRVVRSDVKFQNIWVLKYVFAPRTAHLYIVMNSHVNVEEVRVLEFLVARAAFENVASGVFMLLDFVNLKGA